MLKERLLSRTCKVFVKVSATDPTPFHLNQAFSRIRFGDRDILDPNISLAVISSGPHLA
jgi:hypothetical protein